MALSIADKDQAWIWHPYTQHKNRIPSIAIVRGEGALLYDESGHAYIDAISSWWVNIHGHAHPYIAESIYAQALKLEQVIFTGFTHEPAVRLAEKLLPLLPGNFSKLFYSDNGSTAVEVALKMAMQYWANKSQPSSSRRRQKILAFRNAYHGDTFGAMSVSERGIFTLAFADYLFDVLFIDPPDAENLEKTKALVDQHADEICCLIYEPLLQGAGGMRMMDPGALDRLLMHVQSLGILCIADEVLTGFGRTGRMFAGEYLTRKADIICLSKGLTGGTMALGATATSQAIFDAFLSDDRTHTFFHGHSFTANPLACSAALASLELFEKDNVMSRVNAISASHEKYLSRCRREGPSGCKNHRNLGTVLAFEVDSGRDGYLNAISAQISHRALEKGIFLRPLGNSVYVLPPYCIDEEQLHAVYRFLDSLQTSAMDS